MHIDVIQSVSLAGDSLVPNDDRAGSMGRLAWAIDGATDLGEPGLMGSRGGSAWYAAEADAALAAAEDMPLAEMIAALIERLRARFDTVKTRGPLGLWELPSASLIVARVADDALEVAWLGDCAGLLRGADGVERLGEPPRVKDKESALVASTGGHGQGGVRTRTAPVLSALREARNKSSVRIFGEDAPGPGNIRTARIACAPGDDILLMTDGFSALTDAYGMDSSVMMTRVTTEGLLPLATDLRAIEAEDAACTRFPRFKKSDDATAIWARIAG
jgi:hypothetical protein